MRMRMFLLTILALSAFGGRRMPAPKFTLSPSTISSPAVQSFLVMLGVGAGEKNAAHGDQTNTATYNGLSPQVGTLITAQPRGGMV